MADNRQIDTANQSSRIRLLLIVYSAVMHAVHHAVLCTADSKAGLECKQVMLEAQKTETVKTAVPGVAKGQDLIFPDDGVHSVAQHCTRSHVQSLSQSHVSSQASEPLSLMI